MPRSRITQTALGQFAELAHPPIAARQLAKEPPAQRMVRQSQKRGGAPSPGSVAAIMRSNTSVQVDASAAPNRIVFGAADLDALRAALDVAA
jgi:hypothetical protein